MLTSRPSLQTLWRPSRDTAQVTSSACRKYTTCSSPVTGWTKLLAPACSTTCSGPYPGPPKSTPYNPRPEMMSQLWSVKALDPSARLSAGSRPANKCLPSPDARRGLCCTAPAWGRWRCGGPGESLNSISLLFGQPVLCIL